MKAKLLVIELWGLGDLALATNFLRAATREFAVTLVAKPVAVGLQAVLWPEVEVVPWTAPWTAFRGKYRLWEWRWGELGSLLRRLRAENFAVGISARRDPRDHFFLAAAGARRRVGFGRLGSGIFLSETVTAGGALQHRYDAWRAAGGVLGLSVPARGDLRRDGRGNGLIVIHSGAAQAVRVWPLERWRGIVQRLRAGGRTVAVLGDAKQAAWWREHGEGAVRAPAGVAELVSALPAGAVFVGNDSGPGHVAAALGLPTFTVFGPQLPELFAPVHAAAEWVEGKGCVYKPCFDACRFAEPHCLLGVSEVEVWARLEIFLTRNLDGAAGADNLR